MRYTRCYKLIRTHEAGRKYLQPLGVECVRRNVCMLVGLLDNQLAYSLPCQWLQLLNVLLVHCEYVRVL